MSQKVMPDLVPEMTEQRAERLAHQNPPSLPLGIVGFRECDGDYAVIMASHHLGAGGRVGEEVEHQPVRWVLNPVAERQSEP